MGKEKRLKWLEALKDRVRFYRWFSAALIIGMLTGGLLMRPTPAAALGVAVLAAPLSAAASYIGWRPTLRVSGVAC